MSEQPPVAGCLNCGAELHGAFCAACGQRHLPPDPTVSELAGDAWHELSGYDGRIARTLRALLHPGRLTTEYLAAHRARYVSPVRVYLVASVVYFVFAAASPDLQVANRDTAITAPGVRISLNDAGQAPTVDDVETAPWILRPLLREVVRDPNAMRDRIFNVMPRVFVAMLPVFAAFCALFYRGRRFPTHLVFAAHLHAFAFLALTMGQISRFTYSVPFAGAVSSAAGLALGVYGLMAFRAVYGEPWKRVVARGLGIAFLYMLSAIPAFFVILTWAALT